MSIHDEILRKLKQSGLNIAIFEKELLDKELLDDELTEPKGNESLENELWSAIDSNYVKKSLQRLYRVYFHDLVNQFPTSFSKNKVLKALEPKESSRKEYFVNVLYTIFTDKEVFHTLLSKMPESAQVLFNLLVWNRNPFSEKQLKSHYKIAVQKLSDSGDDKDRLLTEFLIFCSSSDYNYDWRNRQTRYRYHFYFPTEIKNALKPFLEAPPEYELHTVAEALDKWTLYENREMILEELPLFLTYIEQGQLQLSKTGKPLRGSLKELSQFGKNQEFYQEKGLEFIKTELMLNILSKMEISLSNSPLELVKKVFDDYQKNKRISLLDVFLFHLKGIATYHTRAYHPEGSVAPVIWNQVLKALPPNEWVSFSNIANYAILHDLNLQCVDVYSASRYLYYTQERQEDYGIWEDKIYISAGIYDDAIIVPLLAGHFFLFAAFGLVDIAYGPPLNPHLKQKGHEYFSVFDGLQYIRLTDLGVYVTGKTSTYEIKQQNKKQVKLVLDDRRLLFSMNGEDHLKQIIIEKLAKPIAHNRYKMDYESFLKGCTSKNDVQEKIKLFHTHIEAKPSLVWETFFEKALNRVNPLSEMDQLVVYRLDNDPELLHLMTKDEILKKYILKVENFHVAIERSHYAKVKKRLEILGYLMTK
ncbi:hypothetical protein WDW89_10765 [Deltaproteobacteria bacterium TL4]